MEHIIKYFPGLDETQKARFAKLGELYPEWNEKINVISRKDIDNLYVNHILHSLGIVKFVNIHGLSILAPVVAFQVYHWLYFIPKSLFTLWIE